MALLGSIVYKIFVRSRACLGVFRGSQGSRVYFVEVRMLTLILGWSTICPPGDAELNLELRLSKLHETSLTVSAITDSILAALQETEFDVNDFLA